MQAPFYPSEYLEHSLGIRITGYKNLAILMVPQHALMRDWWEVPMPHIMHALRMPDLIKTDRGRFIWLVVAAIVISLGVSCYASLSLIYKEGGLNLGYGGVWTSRQPYKRIASFLLHPSSPNRAYSIGILIGGLVTWIMLFLRSTFLWWPLHPIGYALGASHSPYTIWSSFFVGNQIHPVEDSRHRNLPTLATFFLRFGVGRIFDGRILDDHQYSDPSGL